MEFNTLSTMGLITAQSLTFSVVKENLPAVRTFTGRVPVLETTENSMGEFSEFTVVAKTEDGFRDLHWLRGGIASLVKID
jgi:hypothetical protein